jgi:hypothetical protein
MKLILFVLPIVFLISISNVGASGQSKIEVPTNRGVAGHQLVIRHLSSLWRVTECKWDIERNENFCHYLRFYPDGTVIGVTTSGNPNEIKRWFRRPYDNTGSYVIDGSAIRFSLVSPAGKVDYEGTVSGNIIQLKIHSHINGFRASKEYVWVKPRKRSHRNPQRAVNRN